MQWRRRPHPAATAAAAAAARKKNILNNGRTSVIAYTIIVNRFILVNSWYSINRLRDRFSFYLFAFRLILRTGPDWMGRNAMQFRYQSDRVQIHSELRIPSRALMLSLMQCALMFENWHSVEDCWFTFGYVRCLYVNRIAFNHVNFAVAAAFATVATKSKSIRLAFAITFPALISIAKKRRQKKMKRNSPSDGKRERSRRLAEKGWRQSLPSMCSVPRPERHWSNDENLFHFVSTASAVRTHGSAARAGNFCNVIHEMPKQRRQQRTSATNNK